MLGCTAMPKSKAATKFYELDLLDQEMTLPLFFAGKDQKIYVSCGCFSGDIDAFEQAVKETHGDNKYGKQYQRLIALAKEEIVLGDCE